jgi:hypothetical protein
MLSQYYVVIHLASVVLSEELRFVKSYLPAPLDNSNEDLMPFSNSDV